jgi:hypothetical protein
MALSLDPATKVISVPQADLTFSGAITVFGTDSQDAGASATSVTLTEPPGSLENDLMVVLVKNDATGSTWTPPSDFTEIDEVARTGNQLFWLGYKVRGTDAGQGYTFSHDFGGGTNTAGIMVVYRSNNALTPLDVTYVRASHSTESTDDLSYAPSTITTNTNNAVVAILSGWSGGPGAVSWSGISGYTTDVNLEGGGGRNLNALSKRVPAAGLETPGSFGTTGDAGEDGASFTIAIRPAATAAVYVLDSNQFRKDVMSLLASEPYAWMPDAFIHNTQVTVAGITYARTLEFINGYSVTFEDTGAAYTVRIEGSNNNIFDVENGILNPTDKVTIISTNSAGLISAGTALSALEQIQLDEIHKLLGLNASVTVTITPAGVDTSDSAIDIDFTGDGINTTTMDRQ